MLEALACRELVRPYEADHEPVQIAAARIDKMIADEFAITRDEQERIIAAVLLPNKARGSFRICSATDPEATIRNHGPDKKDFGFNAAVAATDEGLTQLLAQPMPDTKKNDTFTARHCHLSDDGLSLTCPHGRISRRKYRSGSGEGHIFRFLAAQCLGCPLLANCRGSDDTPTSPRNFFVSSYMTFFLLLLALSRTEAFRQQMKQRPRIELVIAHLVLFHGARRARCRGTAKVDYQLKMAAMTYNVKWWLGRLRFWIYTLTIIHKS